MYGSHSVPLMISVRMRLCRWRGQLDCRRKACTAEAADTSLTNQLEQRRTLQRTIIEVGLELDSAVLAIAIDDDRIGEHA